MGYSLVHDFAEQEVVYRFTRDSEVEYALIRDNDGWLTPCIRFLRGNPPYTEDMWGYDEDNWQSIISHLLREREQLLRDMDKIENEVEINEQLYYRGEAK